MPRFSKGTTDHDNDGRMGGSRKGDRSMAKKPAAKKAAAKPDQKAIDAAKTKAGMNVQSGMDPSNDTDAQRERVAAQFRGADADGDPRAGSKAAKEADEAEARAVQQQVRGF